MADYSKLLTGLEPGANYAVQIRSRNTDGEASEWSNTYSFSTPDAKTAFGSATHPITGNILSGSVTQGPGFMAITSSSYSDTGIENFIISTPVLSSSGSFFRTTIGTGLIAFGWNNSGQYTPPGEGFRTEYAKIALLPNAGGGTDSELQIFNTTGSITMRAQQPIIVYNSLKLAGSTNPADMPFTASVGDIGLSRPGGVGGYVYFGKSSSGSAANAYIGFGGLKNTSGSLVSKIEISDPILVRGSIMSGYGTAYSTSDTDGILYLGYSGGDSSSHSSYIKWTASASQLTSSHTITSPSDSRIKRNINPIHDHDLLTKIKNLIPVEYNLISSNTGEINDRKSFGFVAQQINDVFPNIVYGPTETESEYESRYHLDYTALIPILTKAIQLQQIQIEQLTESITQLQNDIIGLGG